MGYLWVEEPVHTSWSRFCIVNHLALASNYKLSNMKCPGRDSNHQPQRLKASTLTSTSLSPLKTVGDTCIIFGFSILFDLDVRVKGKMNKSTQGLCWYFIVSNIGPRVAKTANNLPIANVHQSNSGMVSGYRRALRVYIPLPRCKVSCIACIQAHINKYF